MIQYWLKCWNYFCNIFVILLVEKDGCCSSQDLHYHGSFLCYAYRTVMNFKRSEFGWGWMSRCSLQTLCLWLLQEVTANLINHLVPNQPHKSIVSDMSGLDRCLSDHCVLLFKRLGNFQDTDIRSNTKCLTKWHWFVRYRITEKVAWDKSLQYASFFLEALTFPC